MNELQTLLEQKNLLIGKVRRIAETFEGTSNGEKVAALNSQRAKLSAQRNNLQNKLEMLTGSLVDLDNEIQTLSKTGLERILDAIKNQRWYFFKNKPRIIFDRDTALLWANLQYFPYGKNGNSEEYSAREIKNLLTSVNTNGIDDYKGWKIPTPFELSRVVEDKTCPYHAPDLWKMMKAAFWCVNCNGNYRGKVLEPNLVNTSSLDMNHGVYVYGNWNYNVFVLPCTAAIVPFDYEDSISPYNPVYSEAEKLQMTLGIFLANDLEPVFNDAEVNEIFRQIYNVKPDLQEKLAAVQKQIDELSTVEKISPQLDWRALRLKFDAEADSSPIRYAAAIQALTEFLLARLDELQQPEKLSALRAELEDFRAEAVELQNKILAAKTLAELAEIKSARRAPFEFVVEALVGKICATLTNLPEENQ